MIHQVFFLISGQRYFTFLYRYAKHNREGGKKEQTNIYGLGSAPSARSGEVYVTFYVHSVFLWTNASVYSSENSYKATSNADLTSRVGPPSICRSTSPSSRFAFLTSVDWSPLCLTLISLTDRFYRLVFSAPFCWLSPGAFLSPSFRSRRKSHAQALCVGFTAKQTKGFSEWHPHTHPHKECPTSCHKIDHFRSH